jgi:cell division septum initiation protein DivIVA
MKNIFRRRKTNEEKVRQSITKVESALSMFTEINSDLEEVNGILETVIAQDTDSVSSININIENANAELVANKQLQEKIKQFIKGDNE